MYEEFYNLKEDPFRLSPDHAFCYRHPSFVSSRASLQEALDSAEGFALLTGSPGMGKTMLVNDLLSDYGPSDHLVATLASSLLGAADVVRSAAFAFGLEAKELDKTTILQRLKQLFMQCHQQGCQPLLVVDEAQHLSLEALDELRLLTNTRVDGKPLLQIILIAQNQLQEKQGPTRLEQLLRASAAHLEPLTLEQTAAYVYHRLKTAGWSDNPKIMKSVIPMIYSTCQGVPRRINQFCSRLLLRGATEDKTVLDKEDARAVYDKMSEEKLCVVPPDTEDFADQGFIDEENISAPWESKDASSRPDGYGALGNAAIANEPEPDERGPTFLEVERENDTLSPSRQWLDVESWAAAVSCLRRTRLREAPRPSDSIHRLQKPSQADGSLSVGDSKRERFVREVPRLTVVDNDADTLVTFIMAIVVLAGLMVYLVFGMEAEPLHKLRGLIEHLFGR
jgi:type II secretory pathway predicted ATPase ExeA